MKAIVYVTFLTIVIGVLSLTAFCVERVETLREFSEINLAADGAKKTLFHIDVQHANKGMFTVKYTGTLRAIVEVRESITSERYLYYLDSRQSATFGLYNSGEWNIICYEKVNGTRYNVYNIQTVNVSLEEPNIAYTNPTAFCDYKKTGMWFETVYYNVIKPSESALYNTEAVFKWVSTNIEYDEEKANNLPDGYRPDLERVVLERTGLCTDYAGLMAGLLRKAGIPVKIVLGYADNLYHAWCEVYLDGEWVRYDPTVGFNEEYTYISQFIR